MKDELILHKYTRALFEVAEEQGVLEKVESDLLRIGETFEKLPELKEFLNKVKDAETLVEQMIARVTQAHRLESMRIARPSLDDVFLHHTGRALRD